MSLPLVFHPFVFHPSVYDDVDEAYRRYESQRPGLGDDFLAAVEEVYHRISVNPLLHQQVFQDIRRTMTR